MSNADEDALRAMRAASPALQERWPDGESPRSWKGVTWSGDRVQGWELADSFRRDGQRAGLREGVCFGRLGVVPNLLLP